MENNYRSKSQSPTRCDLIAITIIALFLRVAVFFSASITGHIPLSEYTAKADSASYIAYASAIDGERPFQSMDEYDRRVFPGYAAMIALVHLAKIPLSIAALLVTWFCAAIAASIGAMVFDDRRVGYAIICLIPHYLINSSLAMSEAPMLAVTLFGVLLAIRKQRIAAGILLGLALLIRPMACFAIAGVMLMELSSAALIGIIATVTFAGGVLALQLWTGNALQGVHIYANHPGAYGGHMIVWPFESLILTPFREPTSVGRIIYTWIHVAITLVACTLTTITFTKARRPEEENTGEPQHQNRLAFPWLVGNTLFVLCIGSAWGFRHFPRFTVPAQPAMFWTLRRWLPENRFWWILIVLGCFVSAVIGVRTSP
jgi:hypothetical protein